MFWLLYLMFIVYNVCLFNVGWVSVFSSVYNCCGERLHLNFIDRETQRHTTNREPGDKNQIKWTEIQCIFIVNIHFQWNMSIVQHNSFRNAMDKPSTASPHPSCQKKCPYWSGPDPPRVAQKMSPPIGVARAIRIDKKTQGGGHSPLHSAQGIFPPRFSSSGWQWAVLVLARAGAKGANVRWRGGGQRIRGSIQNAFKPWFLPAPQLTSTSSGTSSRASSPHTELTSSDTPDNAHSLLRQRIFR